MKIRSLINLNIGIILFAGLMSIEFLVSDNIKVASIALFAIFISVMISLIIRNIIEMQSKDKLQMVIDEFLKQKKLEVKDEK